MIAVDDYEGELPRLTNPMVAKALQDPAGGVGELMKLPPVILQVSVLSLVLMTLDAMETILMQRGMDKDLAHSAIGMYLQAFLEAPGKPPGEAR